jgi:hypothetical protein
MKLCRVDVSCCRDSLRARPLSSESSSRAPTGEVAASLPAPRPWAWEVGALGRLRHRVNRVSASAYSADVTAAPRGRSRGPSPAERGGRIGSDCALSSSRWKRAANGVPRPECRARALSIARTAACVSTSRSRQSAAMAARSLATSERALLWPRDRGSPWPWVSAATARGRSAGGSRFCAAWTPRNERWYRPAGDPIACGSGGNAERRFLDRPSRTSPAWAPKMRRPRTPLISAHGRRRPRSPPWVLLPRGLRRLRRRAWRILPFGSELCRSA